LSWQGGAEEDASASELEVFPKFHQIPFSKMLTFYRKEPFDLYAKYSDVNNYYPERSLDKVNIQSVVPQVTGENSKVKVKVRVDKHGIFNVSGATLVEKVEPKEEINEKKMEVDNNVKSTENGTENSQPQTEETVPESKETNPSDESMDVDPQNKEKQESKENESPKENGEVNGESEKKEEPKKSKNTVKTIDLPVVSSMQMADNFKHDDFELEAKMIAQDKLERERAAAKNDVEEYIYSMRDRLYTSLEKFVKEDDRSSLSKLLEQTENWLYEDGEDENKSVYVEKLSELKKFGQPIVDRYQESQTRPKLLEELGRSIMLINKALSSYHSKEETYIHIDPEEMKKVEKCVNDKAVWYETNVQKLNMLKPFEDAHIKSSEIYSQRQSLESTCHPILNKPKPKPKEEPPKEEKKEESKPDSNTDSEQKPEKSEENKESMELD